MSQTENDKKIMDRDRWGWCERDRENVIKRE